LYDIIGDIHGHADELKALLAKMGYSRRGDGFAHASRRAIFVGDFIDRGPQIAEVLTIVRAMVDSGAAQAVMGNHEFNAIAYHTEKPGGGYFRSRLEAKNVNQHQKTLDQVPYILDWVEWFKTLPVSLDLEKVRVVHACWDAQEIDLINDRLKSFGPFTVEFLREALPESKSGDVYWAVEHVLKGKELPLPPGLSYRDKDGHKRHEVRIRWFDSPVGKTWPEFVLGTDIDLPSVMVPADTPDQPYPVDAPPVFFGHYWLKAEIPELLAPNVCCVDYSVAKGGKLVAYRFDGEMTLSDAKFAEASAFT
jgi:hypothetical protein